MSNKIETRRTKVLAPECQHVEGDGLTFVETGGDVSVRDTPAMTRVLSEAKLDKKTFFKKIDQFLRELAVERLSNLHADELIAKEINRRVEVAVKTVAGRIEGEITSAAQNHLKARLREEIDKLEISLDILISS